MGKFTTIDHEIREKFDLTLNEYAIIDSIYFLSRGRSCSASKNYLGDFIGISKQSVHAIINKMIEKKLITRTGKGVLETTDLWNDEIYNTKIPNGKESLPHSKESLPSTVKKVYSDSKESLPNIYSISTEISTSDTTSEKATAQVLFGLIKDFFSRQNANYYHDAKQATSIKKIISRLKEKEKVEQMLIDFAKFRGVQKWWSNKPMTPSIMLSAIDHIIIWKDQGGGIENQHKISDNEAVDWYIKQKQQSGKKDNPKPLHS